MSLMSMRRKMASKRTSSYILWLLIVVFAVTAVFWSMSPSDIGEKTYTGPANVAIATVNGENIVAGELEDKYSPPDAKSQARHYFTTAMDDRQKAFDAIVQQVILDQAVENLGIRVWFWTPRSFAKEFARFVLVNIRDNAKKQAETEKTTPKEQRQNPNDPPKTYEQIYKESLKSATEGVGVKVANPTEDDYIRGFVSKAGEDEESGGFKTEIAPLIQQFLVGEHVIDKMQGVSPLTEEYAKKLYTKEVKAGLIFIAAKENTPKALEDAKVKAQQLRDGIVSDPASFAKVARAESADKVTGMKGGDLGWIKGYEPQGITSMTEYLAYANEKNTISPIMLSTIPGEKGTPQAGYLLVKIDDVRDRDMKAYNWEEDKQSALLRVKFRYSREFGQNYLDLQRASANIVRLSNELLYYDAMSKHDTKKMDELRPLLLQETMLPQEVIAALKYELKMREKDPAKRAELLESIIGHASSQEQSQFIFELAEDYIASKQTQKALEQLRNIATAVSVSGDEYGMLHTELKKKFKKLGATKDVQEMDAWLKAHPAPKGAPGGMPPGMMMNMPPR